MIPSNTLPVHLRAATNFGLGSNLAVSNQSRKWVKQARGDSQHTSRHAGEHCTLQSVLQKTSWTHCDAPASGGNGSFLFHPPALPLLLSPHISFATQYYSSSSLKPRGAQADHPLCFLWKDPDSPKRFLTNNHDVATTTSNCVHIQLSLDFDCKCAQSLKQCCHISCHQAY